MPALGVAGAADDAAGALDGVGAADDTAGAFDGVGAFDEAAGALDEAAGTAEDTGASDDAADDTSDTTADDGSAARDEAADDAPPLWHAVSSASKTAPACAAIHFLDEAFIVLPIPF